MDRATVGGCIAFILALLSSLPSETRGQPKGDNRQPTKAKEVYVIVKANLYEVDEAFSKRLAKSRWHSKADLEKLESQPTGSPQENSLFTLLEKQKLVLAGKEVNIDLGQEGVLLASTRAINCLPSPEQLRQGHHDPRTLQEGVVLRAHAQVSADRRFVRLKLTEKSLEVEGTEKVNVTVDKTGKEAVGENVFLKEGEFSRERDIPDGGGFLLLLQYRPRAARDKDRWLVVEVHPRIYIEAEEQERRRPFRTP